MHSLGQAMLDGAAAEIWKMGVEIASERHVQHLHPTADAQERQVGSRHRRASELDLEVVALFRNPIDRVVRVAGVAVRRDVATSRENDSVEAVEQSGGVALSRRQDQGHGPGRSHRLDVARRQRENLTVGEAGIRAGIGGDSDSRASSAHKTFVASRPLPTKMASSVDQRPAPLVCCRPENIRVF